MQRIWQGISAHNMSNVRHDLTVLWTNNLIYGIFDMGHEETKINERVYLIYSDMFVFLLYIFNNFLKSDYILEIFHFPAK